jgi:hypothetical protein
MRVVSETDALENFSALLRDPDGRPILINDGENDLRVIVSLKDFEVIRKAQVDRLMLAMKELGKELRAGAAEQGISLEELERMLDRKAKPDSH